MSAFRFRGNDRCHFGMPQDFESKPAGSGRDDSKPASTRGVYKTMEIHLVIIRILAAATSLFIFSQEGAPSAPQKPTRENVAPPASEVTPPAQAAAPQDFGEALRQHLKTQGEGVNPEEVEDILGTLEEIRSAVGGPALWPDDLTPPPGTPIPAGPDRQPQPGHLLPPVQPNAPMWNPSVPPGGGPDMWIPPHPPQVPQMLPEPWKQPEVTFEHALRQAARLLDQAAAELEEQSRFDQADRLREQAQQLRIEAREANTVEPQDEPDSPPRTSSIPRPFQPGAFKQTSMVIQVLR